MRASRRKRCYGCAVDEGGKRYVQRTGRGQQSTCQLRHPLTCVQWWVAREDLRLTKAGGYCRILDAEVLVHWRVRDGDFVDDTGEGGLEVIVEDDWFLNTIEDFGDHR